MRTTSATRSPKIIAACGPGPIPASSTTRNPLSGPAMTYRPFVCSDAPGFPFASSQLPSTAAHPGRLGRFHATRDRHTRAHRPIPVVAYAMTKDAIAATTLTELDAALEREFQ